MQIDRPIAIALVILVILLLMFFLVMPEYSTFQQLQNQLGEKTAQYNAQYDYYSAVDKAYYDLQSRKDDISKIDDALPQDPSLGYTAYFLQDAAKQNGLLIKNLSLSKSAQNSVATNATNIKNIVFSVDLSGDYPSLEGFLSSLEKSSRLFEITSISFNSKVGPPYDFNLQIKTYSY